ncbi:hypothetical protein [Microbulbifer sp. JMSA003]|uniref:hypothetical protein n=1 Tax=Microbulbifer sp. JMSA003 TaxID=3243369 RepID=UPI0040394506
MKYFSTTIHGPNREEKRLLILKEAICYAEALIADCSKGFTTRKTTHRKTGIKASIIKTMNTIEHNRELAQLEMKIQLVGQGK